MQRRDSFSLLLHRAREGNPQSRRRLQLWVLLHELASSITDRCILIGAECQDAQELLESSFAEIRNVDEVSHLLNVAIHLILYGGMLQRDSLKRLERWNSQLNKENFVLCPGHRFRPARR